MSKRMLLIGVVILVIVVGVAWSGQQEEAAAACTGNECVDCVALDCDWSAAAGHCECSTGIVGGGTGRYCIAAGVCIPKV